MSEDFVNIDHVRRDLHDMAARCADSADPERHIRDAATLATRDFTVAEVMTRLQRAHIAMRERITQVDAVLAASKVAPDPLNPWAAPMAIRLALADTLIRAYLTEPCDAFPLVKGREQLTI